MSEPNRPGSSALRAAGALARASLRFERPDRLPRAMAALAVAGPTMAGAVAAATARYPLAPAMIDAAGKLTYARLWQESDGVARKLRANGVGPGVTVGLLHRNHRGFVISFVAAAKVGADVVFLNTAFAAPQLADVIAGEAVEVVLHDDEDADAVAAAGPRLALGASEMDVLGRQRAVLPFVPSRHVGRTVILTSGTTGRPKGAQRSGVGNPDALTPLLSTIPIRARDTVVIAAPLFHAWGLSHLGIGMGLSSTAVVQRHFDPEGVLALMQHHRPAGLVVVPIMLQRILALGGETIARYDTSSLRYIASSGSALSSAVVTETLQRFGPILFNVYGSTEVSLATIATPDDLLDAPSTAGRRLGGATVRILDDTGQPVPVGETGRIFVGSGSRFEGYTGGTTKESVDGLLSSGDVGHFDADGLLYIDGRDDDMIVSGGENVFPAEVEDLLSSHPAVAEAAVVGVPDEEFGQRLKAFVVRRPGHTLTAAEVKAHVRGQLARYKVPGQVQFVRALPRTATGKLRRTDLR